MKYLLEIAEAIGTQKEEVKIHKTTQTHKAEIEEEVKKATDKDIDKIIAQLFPSGTPSGTDFYNTLQKFQKFVGHGPIFYVLGGRIWSKAYSEIAPDKRKELLESLFDEKGRGVWRAIFYLPEFCSRVEIEAQFATGWFYRFGNIVKDDMANWDFFNGVKNYAFYFPISGMKVFEAYISEKLDNLKITLAALLLGTIRSQIVKGGIDRDIVNNWDAQIRKNTQLEMRLIYHRSLPTSFDMGSLSTRQLNNELDEILKGEPEEVNEAFSIVWRCMRSERADDNFAAFAMNWFSKNAKSDLPDFAKYHLVNAMWFFRTPGKQKININASDADDLLIAIQPIPENNRGTWEYLETYLLERLREYPDSFENILGRFVDTNPKGFIAQFQSEAFEHIKSEICQNKLQDFVTRWSLSTDTNKRKIARTILQKAETIDLSQNVILEANEKQLEIILTELINKPIIVADKISEYLLSLEPAFRNINPELKQVFKNEMILQAINYPIACLEKWKKIENPSELLKEVIVSAENYFERLNALKDSPAISFAFPWCNEAVEREASEFSNKVSKGAKEKSIFANMVKHTQIIYGSRWAVMTVDGKLGQAMDFAQVGHSMELPRVEIIDPEGMAIRRIQSSSRTEEIK